MHLDLPDADCVLIVPPLAHLTWPSLGAHSLQAVARRAGFRVHVFYANLWFARQVGAVAYAGLCNAPTEWLLGERLFCAPAWDLPPLGRDADAFLATRPGKDGGDRYLDHLSDATGDTWTAPPPAPPADLRATARAARALVDSLAPHLARYPIVGATTSFDQTAAAVALLRAVKRIRPGVVTILGGANCDGPMAAGLADITPVDHVFRGESERSFVDALHRWRARGTLGSRIVTGAPIRDLDDLPCPDPGDWLAQVGAFPELDGVPLWHSYETSRGCWWGQKHHCTFCGLNAEGMGYREKSPDKVLADLAALATQGPRRVALTDNIMPHRYHRSLIPHLSGDLHLFYEQKANLSLEQVEHLYRAGNRVIQPGIEALSTGLLRAMRKGVTARQNVTLLRWARCVGMGVKWNLLHALPGDRVAWYRETLALLPWLEHLNPPQALVHLSLDRFSPYFDAPADFGISDVRPLPTYAAVFPAQADLGAIAYHFEGTWPTASHAHPALMADLHAAVGRWRASWQGAHRPMLHLARAGGSWVLTDTRAIGSGGTWMLSDAQAHVVAHGTPADGPLAGWALRHRWVAELDDALVPLATATPDALRALAAPVEHTGPITLGALLGAPPASPVGRRDGPEGG